MVRWFRRHVGTFLGGEVPAGPALPQDGHPFYTERGYNGMQGTER